MTRVKSAPPPLADRSRHLFGCERLACAVARGEAARSRGVRRHVAAARAAARVTRTKDDGGVDGDGGDDGGDDGDDAGVTPV